MNCLINHTKTIGGVVETLAQINTLPSGLLKLRLRDKKKTAYILIIFKTAHRDFGNGILGWGMRLAYVVWILTAVIFLDSRAMILGKKPPDPQTYDHNLGTGTHCSQAHGIAKPNPANKLPAWRHLSPLGIEHFWHHNIQKGVVWQLSALWPTNKIFH